MAEGKWSYRLDEPNAHGIIEGYRLIKPNGNDGPHVTLNDGAASREEVEFRAQREVADLNGEALPKLPRPEAVVQGKRS